MTDLNEKARLVARGQRAAQMLDDELSVEVFEAVRKEFYNEWLGAKDPRLREAAWYGTHALEKVRTQLRRIVSEGEHAQAVLQKAQ